MRFHTILLLCVLLCATAVQAQTIRFTVEDEVSKKMVAYDSIAIVRLRDSARIVTRGSSVNFSTVGVDEEEFPTPRIIFEGSRIRCTGFSGLVRCYLTNVLGSERDIVTEISGSESIAQIPSDVIGWHGITVTDGVTTIRRFVALQDNTVGLSYDLGKNATIAAKEAYYAIIYIGSFTSIKQYFYRDPASNSLQSILVERPLWMSRVISTDVFESGYPKDTTYHRELFQNKLRTDQTYIWSFAKDSATYQIDSAYNNPYGSVTYVLGDERRAARIIHYDRGAIGKGYDVFDVTLNDRPTFSGNKVIIRCSSSQPIGRFWQELDLNNQIYQESNYYCDGRCIVFTLK